MIQGVHPSGTGHEEKIHKFEDELNNQRHRKRNSKMAMQVLIKWCQFFIMHVDYPLPYQYTYLVLLQTDKMS